MVDIRPNALPAAILPLRTGDAVIVDQGSDGVRQTNPISFTNSVAPVATQSEAQTGTDNINRMTPLRTKQSIASEVGVTLASNSQGAKADSAVQSVNGKSGNSVTLVKGDVGLGNVDNTSDADKPISNSTQTALNAKANTSTTISAGTGLTGGGTLSANRIIALNSASIASLAKADSSVQTVNGVAPTGGNVSVSAEEVRLQDSRASAILESFAGSVNFVQTAGYSLAGDGGGALYKRVPSEPPHAGKFQSADGTWWEYAPESFVNVKCFGAKGDNAADDTVALQAAIDTCGYFGGGRVLMPEGNYRTSESIKIRNDNIELIGANEYATTIRPITAGQDVFVIASSTPSTVEIKGTELRNFAVVTQAAVDNVIIVRNHFQCTIEKVSIWGTNSVGIDVENGSTAYIITMRDVIVENSTDSSIRLGDQGTGDLQNVFMYNCFLSGGGVGDGLTIRNVGGLHWVGGESLNKDTAIRIAPNVSGRRAAGVYVSHVFFDTPQNNVLDSGLVAGTRAHEIQFSNCSFNNSVTGAGAVISGNSDDSSLLQNWTFVSCSFVINHASGAYIQFCRGIDFIGCKMISNGVTSGNGYDIQPTASRVKIIGGKSGDGNGFPAHQQAGVWINSGATDIVVEGVDLNGNTSQIIDQGGVRLKVKDCPGFVSFSRGTSSIAASGTSVTVNHGLSATPTTGDIVIRSVSDTQGPRVWVSAVSSTTFTVSASGNMAAEWFFGWSAGVLGN